MKKTVKVRTNDPERRKLDLVVKGPVERVVKVSPASVHLYGKPGQTLETTVTVTPSERYAFSILKLVHLEGSGIRAELIKPSKKNRSWQVRISGSAPQAIKLHDYVTLKTDSKYKPEIHIRVFFMFTDPEKPKT